MKVVSTEALTKLIQLVKSAFIKAEDVVEVTEIETETPSEVELATVATTGAYSDLSGSPTAGTGISISNNKISVASPTLTNTSTGTDSIAISTNPNGYNFNVALGCLSLAQRGGISIGYNAQAVFPANYGVVIGYGARDQGSGGYNVVIGYGAKSSGSATFAIQLGTGTNSESNSFYVATSNTNNYKMLGNDGKIPGGRLPIATSVTSSSTDDETVGAKLFYDTCGDIESLINAL